jgi:hypothetical protein
VLTVLLVAFDPRHQMHMLATHAHAEHITRDRNHQIKKVVQAARLGNMEQDQISPVHHVVLGNTQKQRALGHA